MSSGEGADSEVGQSRVLPPGARQVTRAEYIELLVDEALAEARELEDGFLNWCKQQVPVWKSMGREETWIRERIAKAQQTRRLRQELIAAGYSEEERRQVVRKAYNAFPQLYELMLEREANDPEGPRVSVIYGTTDDLLTRYVLRQLVSAADRANYVLFGRWQGVSDTEQLAERAATFAESPDDEFIRDLSTIEELRLLLRLAQGVHGVLEQAEGKSFGELESAFHRVGQEARSWFVATYGYAPEQSTTPRVPITLNGPEDGEVHRRRHEMP
jgi:hypothetical protein